MSRASQRNALLIQHCCSPFGTTQFEKTVKNRQKGPVWASKYPFGGPGGPQRAPGCQIWSQLPPFGQTHDNHTVWPCIGPVLAQNAPFGGIGSLPSDQIWLFYCIAWYCMLLNCIRLYCMPYIMVLHAISLYCMVQHSITRGCTVYIARRQTTA